jgi:hypothetical protein
MKNIFIKPIFLSILCIGLFTSCVNDDEFAIPQVKTPFYSEDFQNLDEIQHNTVLNVTGWKNFAEKGTVLWYERIFEDDGYAQFNTFGSADAKNVGWLISPKIDLSGYNDAKFSFQSAQNFVSSDANKLEAYVSSDFDGTNVLAAKWIKLSAKIADRNTKGYTFINSGEISLNKYTNATNIYIGFKAIGSGTDASLDGLFQVNNLYFYTTK